MSQIKRKFIENNAVDQTKVRLDNNSALRGRNAANDADLNLIKANASNKAQIDLELDMNGQVISNVGNVDGRDVSADGAALDSHLNGGINKHDATEVDYERVDGSKKNIDAASDDVELALSDLDDAIGALDATPTNYTPSDASIVASHLEAIDSQLSTTDNKTVKVSTNDTTPGFLEDKVVSANSILSITTLNDGADEDLQLTINQGNIDHGSIAGLADDDHSQYHNDTRGDARYHLKTDLSSNANALGASLIGIEDAAGQYTGTTVEAALTEALDAAQAAQADIDAHKDGGASKHDASEIDFEETSSAPNVAPGTVEAAISDLGNAVGNRSAYTESNYIANGQAVSASLDALDIQVKNNSDDITVLQAGLVYRGSLAAGSDVTANATGNAYLDGGTGLQTGDFFKITGSGNITTSNGTIAVDAGDMLIANKVVALDASIVNADFDKIDNSESADILRDSDLSSTQIFVGNGSNVATAVSMSGDATLSNAGALTIAAAAVTTAKINNDAVDKDKIAADVAGNGLGQNIDGSLEVNVDDSSIEINADSLRVKALGVTNAMLAGSIADSKLNQITTANKVGGSSVELNASGALEDSTGLRVRADASTIKINGSNNLETLKPHSQNITLIAGDITNQYVDLAFAAYSAASISLVPVGGIEQEQAVDYTVALTGGAGGVTRLTFAGDLATAGASELVATDKIVVKYSYLT